jgi:hypothetical protein
MRKVYLYPLVAGAVLGLATAHAQGVLQGLEMDVMEADESPAQATARIALPGAGNAADDGNPDYGSLVTDQALAGGSQSGEAAATDGRDDAAPTGPATDPADAIDVGEPGEGDAGSGVDNGGIGEDPTDPGVIDGDRGDTGVIDPIGEPVDDNPIGDVTEPEPGDIGVIDTIENPDDGTMVGDGIDGGAGAGDVVTILPDDSMPAVESNGTTSGERPL